MIVHATIALLCGAAIALQAALNSSLGKRLGSPLLATVAAFAAGLAFASLFAAVWTRRGIAPPLRSIPVHLWFAGGLLGAFALSAFYWLIPRLGVGTTLSFAVTGQVVLGMLASHWGWFGLPHVPLSPVRLLGTASLVLGVLMIQRG